MLKDLFASVLKKDMAFKSEDLVNPCTLSIISNFFYFCYGVTKFITFFSMACKCLPVFFSPSSLPPFSLSLSPPNTSRNISMQIYQSYISEKLWLRAWTTIFLWQFLIYIFNILRLGHSMHCETVNNRHSPGTEARGPFRVRLQPGKLQVPEKDERLMRFLLTQLVQLQGRRASTNLSEHTDGSFSFHWI